MQRPIGSLGFPVFFSTLSQIAIARNAKECFELLRRIGILVILGRLRIAAIVKAIERSIHNESGWCHKKLNAKSSRFGASNSKATYLRITVGMNRGTSPDVAYVLEIWPSGHYSPIHAHANTYGIIKVLHGEINVKLYRALNVERKRPFQEVTLYKDQVTWLTPGLNQIHKLENKSPNKTCITIQAYEYISDEVSHYEYFDYITNSGHTIDKFDPVSDIDYSEFKEKMITEWNNGI